MNTSLLLVDVQGFESLTKGQPAPAGMVAALAKGSARSQTRFAVLRAYCSGRVSSYRRAAYREAGFEIVDTAGSDETLIRLSLDLADLVRADVSYDELVLLSGSADLSALARLARADHIQVAVAKHTGLPAPMEALADRLIDTTSLPMERNTAGSMRPEEADEPSVEVASKSNGAHGIDVPAAPSAVEPRRYEHRAVETRAAETRPSETRPSWQARDAGDGAAAAHFPSRGPASRLGTATAVTAAGAQAASQTPSGNGAAAAKSVDPIQAKVEPKPEPKPEVDLQLEDAITASLTDDLAAGLPPALPAGAGSGDDGELDEIFADIASAGDAGSTASQDVKAPAPSHYAHGPAKASDDEVDELLTRLMSDDLSGSTPKLDVTPER